MNFEQTPEFKKELKKLRKKWRSLADDIEIAQRVIADLYGTDQKDTEAQREYRAAFFDGKRATIITKSEDSAEVVKMRLDCASLGSRDMLRLVFVYIYDGKTVTFIELFSKSDKSREDSRRIKHYLP